MCAGVRRGAVLFLLWISASIAASSRDIRVLLGGRGCLQPRLVFFGDLDQLILDALVQLFTFDIKTLRQQFEVHANVGDLVADFVREIDAIAPTFLYHIGKFACLAAESEREETLVL